MMLDIPLWISNSQNFNHVLPWILFTSILILLILIDLFWLHKRGVPQFRQALLTTLIWVVVALAFNTLLYFTRGSKDALHFFTAYLLEYSLSVDNLFVFLLIFNAFKIPRGEAHKILLWGILGAIIFRTLMIFFGIALVRLFQPILYLFGAFLILASIKLALTKEKKYDPHKNLLVRLSEKWGVSRFVLVLIAIESTDLFFALDSIPAVFAITLDPFLVFTSNILAVVGLRSLYFVLSGVMELFQYLHYGLAAILLFVGLKMVLHPWIDVPIGISLLIIVILLATSIFASWIHQKNKS